MQVAHPHTIPSRVPSRAARHRKTVLVVEADETVRTIAVAALEIEGHRVLAAADAGAADLLLAAARIDLVVTALDLGDPDGLGLAWRARIRNPGIAVVHASGRHGACPDAAVSGAAFLRKPYRPAALCDLVARMLEPT